MSARTRAPKLFGRAISTSGTAITPSGTLSQKMACQFQPCTTAPPISGPSATPRPEMPPQMPMAAGRSRWLTLPASRVSDRGRRAAAPAPCTARAAISIHGSVARALAALASVKTMMPPRNTERRPSRSPSPTAISIRVAKLSV